MDDISVHFIEHLVIFERYTYAQIAQLLHQLNPSQRGFSERSVRRFCQEHEISRSSSISDSQLDQVTSQVVSEVGPVYGRRTVQGFLSSEGIRVGENRVGRSLARVQPYNHRQRQSNTARQTNPIPYRAEYFGHKLHIDQNEKLVMYEMTHVCAIDGYSGLIVGFITMPIKNCFTIYNDFYRKILLEHGIWDQLRVDHGTEWALMLFVQDLLRQRRHNTARSAYVQSTSRENHIVERVWVEVNSRVNYPLKDALNHLVNSQAVNIEDDIDKFCLSFVTMITAHKGLQRLIAAFNNRRIPGRGVPLQLSSNSMISPLRDTDVPSERVAHELYAASGGRLRCFRGFGIDPLEGQPRLLLARTEAFSRHFGDGSRLFSTVANGDYRDFQRSVLYIVTLTKDLASRQH